MRPSGEMRAASYRKVEIHESTAIRVLHVLGGLGVGGTERQLLELCRRMDRARFQQSVVYYSQSADCLAEQFREAGADVFALDKFAMPTWRFFAALRRVVREARPDIVHTWLYSANFWGRWAAVSVGAGRLVSSNRAEVLRFHPLQFLTDQLLRGRTVRLANSRAVARSLRRMHHLGENDVRVIYNAVECPSIDRVAARRDVRGELGLPDDERIVLMVGRQTVEKNYPLFIRAGEAVCRAHPKVTFVGLGREMMGRTLVDLVGSLGIAGKVRMLDQRSDVGRWYAAADVFCFTSDSEGFPNVVLEAMGAGLPVVCTAFAAVDELLDGPEIGTIVPRGDLSALVEAIRRLLNDDDLRRRMGAAGQARVRERYTYDRLVAEMEQLYAELMAGSHRRRE